MPVVDASVCVALFKADEPGHISSRQWLEQVEAGDEPVLSPVILLPEVASALARGLGDGQLAREAVALLQRRELFELFPVTESLALQAAEIAATQRIRGCDAIYIALAKLLETELVTFDREQLERGAEVVVTRNP